MNCDLGDVASPRCCGSSVVTAPEWSAPLSEAERALVERRRRNDEEHGSYTHLGRTKPQLVTFALSDSPVGLAAYIVHFWREWSDCGGDVERRFTKDELLTTVMLYWTTQTIASAFHPYVDWRLGSAWNPLAWQGRSEVSPGVDSRPLARGERIDVPTAVALFSLVRPPREWGERAYSDIRRWTEMSRGGHFGAMEEPGPLAEEIRAFFRPLRR